MIDKPGSQLLYRAATGLERAMADVDAPRLLALQAELILDQWDPYAIGYRNLPVLAWAMGCRLWDDDWAEHTKRQWVAEQWHFQARRGTRAGIAMALEFMGRDFTGGYELIDTLTAPQGFFASPNIPKDEWDLWIRQMPELRIKLAHGVGLADGEFYIRDAFADDGAAGRDDGPALYGRRVVLRRPDHPDQDLGMVEWETKVEGRTTVDFEQVCIPGLAAAAYIAGEDFEGDDCFVDADELEPELYSYQLDGSYDHVTSELQLSSLPPGLEPINISYERVSDVGEGGPFFFVGDFAGRNDRPTIGGPPMPEDEIAVADNGRDAFDMMADRVYLLDPAVQVPLTDGISFAGFDRVDYPPYHADLLVDLNTREPAPVWVAGETAPGESYASPEVLDDFDRALNAIVGAKAFRDKALVNVAARHPLSFGDIVTSTTLFGDQPRSWL
jgi:phage tail P2-like protein